MSDLLKKQYQMILEDREVVFQYLEKEVEQDLMIEVSTFNGKSIAYMMIHVANTYISWTGNFAMSMDKAYYEEAEGSTVVALRSVFDRVNQIMEEFIISFSEKPDKKIKGDKWPGKYIETDAYSIFTHVITHEFHHKGQSMTMSRLLGHTPPDTDILRF